ncbi:nucleoside-diphosphate-sugar epimerase [Labedaea rhizosphaerae]|uniref:Nucleoside-diphosphate-sugar epimerase n=1 Tax=Labedaea rhizosphaerae TaxID=598644 RepID=A0A4V3CY60_LABRH|nr:nucleoside-diphosphate-sugar epimerase [Labedaea rhizosphaerae]
MLGASGFIGSAVSAALTARPGRLRLVARRPSPVPDDAVADVEVLAADLTAPGVLADAVADADAVVHLVAHTEGGWRVSDGDTAAERVNLGLIEDLVEVCRARDGSVPPVVVFASSALIGDSDDAGGPRTAYCRQKLAAERLLAGATGQGVLRGVSLRLSSVYGHGPQAAPRVVEVMVRKAIAGEQLTMWHDGTIRRDLLHVDDATTAVLSALAHADRLAGGHWPIGTGRGEPLGKVFEEISEIVADHTGEPAVSVVTVDPPPNSYATDLVDLETDASRFQAVTGWRPQVSLRAGLRRTVEALAGSASR